jgi:hypothetical protein
MEAHGNLLKGAAIWEAMMHDFDKLYGAALDHLIKYQTWSKDVRLLLFVWFEASDVVQTAGAERLEKVLKVKRIPLAD